MNLYSYLVEEENKKQEIPTNNPEEYFKRLNTLKETLEQLLDIDESVLQQINTELEDPDDLLKILKSHYKNINKGDLDILISTKQDILYTIYKTFKSLKEFKEQIQYSIDTLSVIYNNEEYTLEELSDLINKEGV